MKKTIFAAIAIISAVFSGTAQNEYPSFINLDKNTISAPTDATQQQLWRKAALKLDSLEKGQSSKTVKILHIGDSHIQAEMGTSQIRERLQAKYGNGGRGLITAFKLAGTNQPVDYAITAENPVDSQARLLKRPWPITPGFTGIAASSNRSNKITYKNLKPEHRFDRAAIFTSNGTRNLRWAEPQDSASFWAFPGEKVYGVYTANGQPGVIYSTIGNNGACFSDYLLIDGFAESTKFFQPDIIVLSMGTNEGFSSMSDGEIHDTTQELIERLMKANPEAALVIWTPMECQKDQKVNKRVSEASKIIAQVAKEKRLPVWDFETVAGGEGASDKWLEEKLMNKDRIHLYKAGYVVQGNLASDAFESFIQNLVKN